MTRVAQASIGHQGHKNLIWIGRGFPRFSLQEMVVDQDKLLGGRVQQCLNLLRDARVTLFTVDPSGIAGLPGATNGLLLDPNGGNAQFNQMAVATGGSALYGRNDVDAEVSRSIRSGSSFYTLSYRPTTASLDPQSYRKIKVTIRNHPDYEVAARTGYYVEQPVERLDPLAPQRAMVNAMFLADTSQLPYTAIPVKLIPQPAAPYRLQVQVAPSPGVVWSDAAEGAPRGVDLLVLGSVYDKGGKELTRVVKSFHVNAPASVPPNGPIEQSIEVPFVLTPHPKAARARVVVRIGSTGRLGAADSVLAGIRPASGPTP